MLPTNTQDFRVELYNWTRLQAREGFGLNQLSRGAGVRQSVSGSLTVQGGTLAFGHAGPRETQELSGRGAQRWAKGERDWGGARR